ncbi:hypothetical protein WN944_006131 [Citrus x changshan-huyou]|uniref:Uncharacterized protein n=1 Tax=Citrus x changshan-huyou TaxID=2935761 RepID=A0AAP0MIP5_9ROSI
MEQLLDLLIEGQPQLSAVVILDSSGFDKTVFAAETYNNNHSLMMSITVYVIPDYQNGSRVLIIVTDVDILTLFELENGEKIALDLLPSGGPLIRINTGKASTSSSVETEAEFVFRKKAGLRWLWWISTTQDFAPEINVLGRRVDNEGRSHAITRKVIYQLEKAS